MSAKPHFKLTVIGNRPVTIAIPERETAVDAARRRFGKPFCYERGTTFKPRETPLLSEWLATRIKEK